MGLRNVGGTKGRNKEETDETEGGQCHVHSAISPGNATMLDIVFITWRVVTSCSYVF